MLICEGSGEKITPYSRDKSATLPLRVFEGNFTNRMDMEFLVEPILGLYGKCLSNETEAHVAVVRQEMQENTSTFFPKVYQPDPNKPATQQLFGQLVEVMEKHTARLAVSASVSF